MATKTPIGAKAENLFSTLRELAHAGVAVIGVLAASGAAVALFLQMFGVHISEADVIEKLGAVGAMLTLISKAIDSANDALKNRKA